MSTTKSKWEVILVTRPPEKRPLKRRVYSEKNDALKFMNTINPWAWFDYYARRVTKDGFILEVIRP